MKLQFDINKGASLVVYEEKFQNFLNNNDPTFYLSILDIILL